ncbi:MAG: ArsA family ATPase [Bradymonadaceae bacterium]
MPCSIPAILPITLAFPTDCDYIPKPEPSSSCELFRVRSGYNVLTFAHLYKRRFVLFTGKGGVGKTTMASAFALSCARRGERTLLMQLNVKDKVSSLFGAERVDTEITEVEDNLFAVNVTPMAAMEEYALMILKVKLIYKAVFENRVVRSFLRVVPGLNELLMLGKAYFHTTETDHHGKLLWDKVILDAPATGHGIFFLKIPSVITSIIGSGNMHEEAQRILALLQDPERTAMVLVTLAEDMPVNETLMLNDVIRDELEMPIGCVMANAVYRPLFDEEETRFINKAQAAELPEEISGFLEAARFRTSRIELQQFYLERLEEKGSWPILTVPYYFMDRMSFATINEISDHFLRHLHEDEETRTRSVG